MCNNNLLCFLSVLNQFKATIDGEIYAVFLSIVLWLLVSTATAYLQIKEDGSFVWFMIGMLLGFLGLLLVFLLPPVGEDSLQRS